MSEFKVGDEAILDCTDFDDNHNIKEFHGCDVLILGRGKMSLRREIYYDVKVPDGYIFCVKESCLREMSDAPVVTSNPVSPDHYKHGGIDPIDYMRMKLSEESFRGFCIGNIIKYVSRYEQKNGLEDLKKAQVYLGWAIDTYESEES